MPKLHPTVIDANREKIEQVALRLFCAQGFHGTSMRQIAQRSRVSLGNIYNYYRTKDELFTSIVNHYAVVMNRERQKLLDSVDDPLPCCREIRPPATPAAARAPRAATLPPPRLRA